VGLVTAVGHGFRGKPAQVGQPTGVRFGDSPSKQTEIGSRYWTWRPLPLYQAQEHVNAIGMGTPPAFELRRVAM